MAAEEHATPPTFTLHTLGCKVNQADSEAISAALIAQGMRPAPQDGVASVVVVNTCTVTHWGDRSSRQALRQARRNAPDALVVATGCYAQMAPAEVAALQGVDLVVANTEKTRIAERIVTAVRDRSPGAGWQPLFPAAENPDDHLLAEIMGRTRVQVKVQDGCDNRCTYCIVPMARGDSRSRAIRMSSRWRGAKKRRARARSC